MWNEIKKIKEKGTSIRISVIAFDSRKQVFYIK
jgi:hypothetical protein